MHRSDHDLLLGSYQTRQTLATSTSIEAKSSPTEMADFLTNLWSSVFTPGPTPTLLIATNVTFAALQLILVALLGATRSIHFVVLSILCAGLWWSINWFAIELERARLAEQDVNADGKDTITAKSMDADNVASSEEKVTEDASEIQITTSTESLDPNGIRRRTDKSRSSDALSTDSEWEKIET